MQLASQSASMWRYFDGRRCRWRPVSNGHFQANAVHNITTPCRQPPSTNLTVKEPPHTENKTKQSKTKKTPSTEQATRKPMPLPAPPHQMHEQGPQTRCAHIANLAGRQADPQVVCVEVREQSRASLGMERRGVCRGDLGHFHQPHFVVVHEWRTALYVRPSLLRNLCARTRMCAMVTYVVSRADQRRQGRDGARASQAAHLHRKVSVRVDEVVKDVQVHGGAKVVDV